MKFSDETADRWGFLLPEERADLARKALRHHALVRKGGMYPMVETCIDDPEFFRNHEDWQSWFVEDMTVAINTSPWFYNEIEQKKQEPVYQEKGAWTDEQWERGKAAWLKRQGC